MNAPQTEPSPSGLLATAIHRPVSVIVGALLVIMFGALSVYDLPIQLVPDITEPQLTIRTRWPGASPTEIESEILEPQEDAIKDVVGLKRLIGEANDGEGSLTLEFAVGTDIDEALVRVSNGLSEVPGYPDSVQEPALETASVSGPPLAVISIRDPKGRDVDGYLTWVENRVIPELQRIPGVGGIRKRGGRDTIYEIRFDPTELAGRGIPVNQFIARIRSELRDVSGGDVTVGPREMRVRTMAVDADPERLEQIVVGADEQGNPVRVRDVGSAVLTLRERDEIALADDRPSIVLLLAAEAGSNVLTVTREVRAAVEDLNQTVFATEGLEIAVLSDQIEYIESSLDLVRQNLLMGAALAVLVLWLFLRSVGAAAIVSVAIPVCAFGTLLGLTLFGRSVNVISLAGVTFAIGMVLDNSIVSLEAIDAWRRRVPSSSRAALMGVREVWGALLASTVTTVAVFIPVLGWKGQVGQLLSDVAVAISFAVITSLAVSVLVIPALAARLPAHKDAGETEVHGRLARALGRLAHRRAQSTSRSLGVVVLAVVASLGSVYVLLPPLEYLPSGNRNLLFGILTPPPGTDIREVEAVGRVIQSGVVAHIGQEVDGVPALHRSFFVGGAEQIFAGVVAEDREQIHALQPWVRGLHASIPGYLSFTAQPSIFGRIAGGRSIEVDLNGRSTTELVEVGQRFVGEIREVLPGSQVRPQPNLDLGTPELRVQPRREEAAAMEVTTDALGQTVDAMIDGTIIGELGPRGSPQVDVVVHAQYRDGTWVEDAEQLRAVPVVTPTGDRVPLGVLAELEQELGPTRIRRTERRRGLTLVVAPRDDIPLEEGIERVRNIVAKLRDDGVMSADMTATITGTAGELERAKTDFARVLLIAVVISYLLMSALFEDFIDPIVVLVSVPLAAAGGTAALRWVDASSLGPQPFDLMTALGYLILIGIVVNNAILVVDGARFRLREGVSLGEALDHAVASRVRPILMTTATSLVGLLPMLMVSGAGSELYRGIGAVVLGGLALSTVLTLFVVPAFFGLMWSFRARVARLLWPPEPSA